MKSTLPATHLLRHFLLFVLTVFFLLTVMRAAYGLWQFPKLEQTDSILSLFVQGLRFDLALIGMIVLVPVVLGSLLAMSDATRGFAKFLITLFLVGGLLLVLVLEMVTPWFVDTQGLRPDLNILASMSEPVQTLQQVAKEHAIPFAIAVLLCLLITIAFLSRLELGRFLRYRLSVPSALTLAVFGGLACIVAIWSTPDLRKPALSPGDSLISVDTTVNELVMNTTYKSLYSAALPYLNR